MTEIKKHCVAAFVCTLIGISFLSLCYGSLVMVDYTITEKTRVHKEVFADGRIKYTAEYEEQNGFGSSRWIELGEMFKSGLCISGMEKQLIDWHNQQKKNSVAYNRPLSTSLECQQDKIDNWLAQRKAQKVVGSEYTKYP